MRVSKIALRKLQSPLERLKLHFEVYFMAMVIVPIIVFARFALYFGTL